MGQTYSHYTYCIANNSDLSAATKINMMVNVATTISRDIR